MGIEVDSLCSPGAPCRARLEAMEAAHQKEMHDLQEKHAQEVRELEGRRDKMLQEESQAAAKGKIISKVLQPFFPVYILNFEQQSLYNPPSTVFISKDLGLAKIYDAHSSTSVPMVQQMLTVFFIFIHTQYGLKVDYVE